jgi:hypothetical protein
MIPKKILPGAWMERSGIQDTKALLSITGLGSKIWKVVFSTVS